MSLGERLTFGEVRVVIHADAASTGGALGVMEEMPPLADTPLHVHTSEDELFYALEGEHLIQVHRQRGELLQRLAVMTLVVIPVVAGADRGPPLLVVAIPVHRPLDPLVEAHGRVPAEGLEAGCRERVAAVVAGAILDVGDPRLVAIGEGEDAPDDLEVGQLVWPADVVDVAGLALREDGVDRGAAVIDV